MLHAIHALGVIHTLYVVHAHHVTHARCVVDTFRFVQALHVIHGHHASHTFGVIYTLYAWHPDPLCFIQGIMCSALLSIQMIQPQVGFTA